VKKALRVLVYEHVSGGDFAAKPISPSVLSEGFGMLRTLTADFRAAGHTILTTLDARIAKINPPLAADRARRPGRLRPGGRHHPLHLPRIGACRPVGTAADPDAGQSAADFPVNPLYCHAGGLAAPEQHQPPDEWHREPL